MSGFTYDLALVKAMVIAYCGNKEVYLILKAINLVQIVIM